MNSSLYFGNLSHRRLRPRPHAFRHSVSVFHLDLDELDELDSRIRLFGVNRRRLVSFYEADHWDGSGSLKSHIVRYLGERGVELSAPRISIVTQCRLFGYVFNPLSLFFCREATGELRATVAEVNNTFGERILYLLPGGSRHPVVAKEMHVSPFISMDARYRFRITPPGERFSVFIGEEEHGEHFFDAHLWGLRRPLDDRHLLRMLVAYPLLPFRITAAIHWQALRLWWKGVPVYRQPAPSAAQLEQHRLLERLAHDVHT